MSRKFILPLQIILICEMAWSQTVDTSGVKISGELRSEQRILAHSPFTWLWNDNRIDLMLSKKIAHRTKFYSQLWFRNFGLPYDKSFADLSNKKIIDPYEIEIREAYADLYGLFNHKLDLRIGRQRIAWGSAYLINPTDNLNPLDLEDVIDFGRHRGSDAVNISYYFNSNFNLQAIVIPIFHPANLPVGPFTDLLSIDYELPGNIHIRDQITNVINPSYSFNESTTLGLKLNGAFKGFDFSLSYASGRNGLPVPVLNMFSPVDSVEGVELYTEFNFVKNHNFGFDFSSSIAGIGFWGEFNATLPEDNITLTTDLTQLFPNASPELYLFETKVIERKILWRYAIGADYYFANDTYVILQFLHGFPTEMSKKYQNDYIFINVEKKFFDNKIKFSPLRGALVVSNWHNLSKNYNIIFIPELSFCVTDNFELFLSASVFNGNSKSAFTKLNDADMVMFKLKYFF